MAAVDVLLEICVLRSEANCKPPIDKTPKARMSIEIKTSISEKPADVCGLVRFIVEGYATTQAPRKPQTSSGRFRWMSGVYALLVTGLIVNFALSSSELDP